MGMQLFPSLSRVPGPLVIGTGGAQISADSSGQVTLTAATTATYPFWAGRGKAAGNPTGTPTLATNGAGVLTGTYQYAYTELTAGGETGLSPVASIAASSNTVRVTVPLSRRGIDRRKLYRTAAGGSVYKLVHDFGGAAGYFQTQWDDNTADGSLGATAPSSDGSRIWELQLNKGVKVFASHPDNLTGPADVTLLTGDPSTPGSFGLDSYAPLYVRSGNVASSNYGSLKTGTTGYHIYCETNGLLDDGSAAAHKFSVDALGNARISPSTLVDGGSNALNVQATMPATITANIVGVEFDFTGAGSSSFSPRAMQLQFLAGYTGASSAYGLALFQQTANTGPAYGLYVTNTGAAGKNIAVQGRATGGTKNIGVFGSLGADADGENASFAMGCDNAATTDDIFRAYDNGSLMFRIQDTGKLNLTALSTSEATTGDFWHDTTLKALKFWNGRTVYSLPGVIATQTADATLANTVTETTLFGTLVGTKTLAANFFLAGKTVRLRARGYLSSTGTPNLTINVKLGSASVVTTGVVAQVGTPTNVGWELDVTITCRTTGASGTVIAEGIFHYGANFMPLVSTSATTIDTTASQVLDFLATWGTAASGNTITCATSSIEVLN